jgi:hypothetical protein
MMLIVSGCIGTQDGTFVWIDVPIDRLTFAEIQPIEIKGHATAPGGVERVDIYINEDLISSLGDLETQERLSSFQTTWSPVDYGVYIIMAFAYGGDGSASPPDVAMVTFSRDIVVELPSVFTRTPFLTTPTETPTRTPFLELSHTPEPGVEFWADPVPVEAGGCTTIYWRVEDVTSVSFGGIEQPFSGSYDECNICREMNFRLIVTHEDGHIETVWLNIPVTGECVTPLPTNTVTPTPRPTDADVTPPPIPSPTVPADGLNLSCRSSQALTWLPVTDPSGIREYRVELQRSTDNSTWNAAPGSPINGILDKTTTIPTDCGWYFRWRVRAVDGVGIMSDWSSWSYFSITLD